MGGRKKKSSKEICPISVSPDVPPLSSTPLFDPFAKDVTVHKNNWVQCCRCSKWRIVPPSIDIDKLPDQWYCSLISWDWEKKRRNCTAPEDQDPTFVKHSNRNDSSSPHAINKFDVPINKIREKKKRRTYRYEDCKETDSITIRLIIDSKEVLHENETKQNHGNRSIDKAITENNGRNIIVEDNPKDESSSNIINQNDQNLERIVI